MRRLLIGVVLTTLCLPTGAIADTNDDFISYINQERAAVGLNPLAVMPLLADQAERHSSAMASHMALFHSDLTTIPGRWRALGENVGQGGDAATLHRAFMDSPEHRANILGTWDHVGVGVVSANGSTFVTEQFWRSAPTTRRHHRRRHHRRHRAPRR